MASYLFHQISVHYCFHIQFGHMWNDFLIFYIDLSVNLLTLIKNNLNIFMLWQVFFRHRIEEWWLRTMLFMKYLADIIIISFSCVFILTILLRTCQVAYKYFILLYILHNALWKDSLGKAGKYSFLSVLYTIHCP